VKPSILMNLQARFPLLIAMIIAACFIGGCGCGDTIANRRVEIVEPTGFSADSVRLQPLDVDTSQLPPGTIKRTDRKDQCGNPVTELRLFPKGGIKIMIVPTTQP
jgi:hypothetical protein